MKVPFRNLPVFPNQVPWPGRLENSTFPEYFDAGRTREIQQIRPAATLLLSVNCLYQMILEKRKGEFEKCGGLPKWSRRTREISASRHRSPPRSPKVAEDHRARLEKPRRAAAKRRNNAAHGASRGGADKRSEATEDRKNCVPHLWQHPASHNILHARSAPMDQTGFPHGPVRLSRWHRACDGRDSIDNQRHR